MVTFSNLGKYGRLGNQMFQIASTIGIAKKNGHDFYFPTWRCHYNGIECQDFFENKLPTTNEIYKTSYVEKNFTYSEIFLDKEINYDLYGYFQSQKYFENCIDEIKFFFTPKNEIVSSLRNEFLSVLKNSCSIHVRRGDYLNFQEVHPVQKIEYYKNSIEHIKSKFGEDINFLIFSDDLHWCKENFVGEKFTFISTGNHVKDMILMSMCDNNIITNSTFSWWAAWIKST